MAKYRVRVTVTDETGVRRPKDREVKWSARRVADPPADLGGGKLLFSRQTDEDGARAGMYNAIKHAESIGETLELDDIEVEVEYVTEILKRQKIVNVRRHTVKLAFKRIFDEIMARPRPLG